MRKLFLMIIPIIYLFVSEAVCQTLDDIKDLEKLKKQFENRADLPTAVTKDSLIRAKTLETFYDQLSPEPVPNELKTAIQESIKTEAKELKIFGEVYCGYVFTYISKVFRQTNIVGFTILNTFEVSPRTLYKLYSVV